MMEITVNNQSLILNGSSTVSQLLSDVLHIPESGIAIAINQEIVTKTNWTAHLLQPGDRVVLIKATQGG